MVGLEHVGTLVSMVVVGMLAGGVLLVVLDAVRRRREGVRADARRLLLVAGMYTLVLVTSGLALPRRILPPGEPECFGDWCVAGGGAGREAAGSACATRGAAVWRVTLEVFSRGWSAGPSAPNATVTIEDSDGQRHAPCGTESDGERTLSDRVAPGESFTVTIPVALPRGRRPAGAVVRHGGLADAVILGSDEAVLRTPALLRLAVR